MLYKCILKDEYNRYNRHNNGLIPKDSHWYNNKNIALQYFKKKGQYYILEINEDKLQYEYIYLLDKNTNFIKSKGIQYNKEIKLKSTNIINIGVKI